MKDLHRVFTLFKEQFPDVAKLEAALGHEIHERGGPLSEETRWLIKIAVSAATGHSRALETHVERAREAGVGEEAIFHALLLVIPTCGFPTFMEAYSVLRKDG